MMLGCSLGAIVRLLLVPSLALCLSMTSARSARAEPATTVLVFDGSGSMWGKLDGDRRSRFHAARDSLRQSLPKIDREAVVGLMSYGHRRSGDCEDIEMIVEPETEAASEILASLGKLNPRGRGPLSQALRNAAVAIADAKGPQSIILVQDDLDNCKGDPCAAAADIRKSHPRLKIHVISVAMRREEVGRMACVAQLTGGRHFDVATGTQMQPAIDEALRLALAPGPAGLSVIAPPKVGAPAPGAMLPKATARRTDGPPGLLLAVALSKAKGAVDIPVRWQVHREGDALGLPVYDGVHAGPSVPLPPGRYKVIVRAGSIRREAGFTVGADGPIEALVSLEAGVVVVSSTLQRGGAGLEGAILSVQGADGATVLITRDPRLILAPGSYTISSQKGMHILSKSVTVKAGAVEPLELIVPVGVLKLGLVAREGGPPIADALFVIYEDDPDAPQGRREIARTGAPEPEFTLPLGTYYVVARHGSAEARDRVVVKAGETEHRVLLAGSARLTLGARIQGGEVAPGLVSFRLERLEGSTAVETIIVSRSAPVLDLAAGRYRIESRLGLLNARVVREVELRAGTNQQLMLEHQAGVARLRLLDRPGGLAFADVFWEIRDDRGQVIWATGQAEPRAPLKAGRYSARGELKDRSGEGTFEVRSGEERIYDVVVK